MICFIFIGFESIDIDIWIPSRYNADSREMPVRVLSGNGGNMINSFILHHLDFADLYLFA